MSAILPIDIDALLRHRTVESERVEFKASWDADTTGRQVIRTICAFANDYHNLNGGYVVIGVEEREGRSVLPPQGLTAEDVEAAQRWIRGQCNRLDPPYPPVLSPECVQDKLVLVIWAPASEMRPHRAPRTRRFKSILDSPRGRNDRRRTARRPGPRPNGADCESTLGRPSRIRSAHRRSPRKQGSRIPAQCR